MAKEEKVEEKKEVELVSLSQETGFGLRMPDGQVVDLTGTSPGQGQVFAYLVKTVDELKKNIG